MTGVSLDAKKILPLRIAERFPTTVCGTLYDCSDFLPKPKYLFTEPAER